MTSAGFVVKVRSVISAMRRSLARARAEGRSVPVMAGKALRLCLSSPRRFVRNLIAYAQFQRPEQVIVADVLLPHDEYAAWIGEGEAPVAMVRQGPKISIVMPVCDPADAFLIEAIDSVKAQSYLDWELCIHDDCSTRPSVLRILADAVAGESRIKVHRGERRGGIAAATNSALELADGRWVCFLDHDDVLDPDALACVVAALQSTGANLAYTDHDILSEAGVRSAPFFKPDWSPDLFLAQMYLGHLVAIEREVVSRMGGLNSSFDGSQDYDLVLRCVRAGARVVHVPRVLYHWRAHSGSTAANADSKPYAHIAGRGALQAHVSQTHPGARVDDGTYTFCYDVRYPLPQPVPRASIIIPTRDGLDLLKVCLDSLRANTTYADYELLIVDNGSTDPATLHWLQEAVAGDARISVIQADVPFNWSVLNNLAAARATGEVLVFLNNDTEVITADWLERLVENALRPEVGVCGPLLLYGDRSIQHAGVVVGMGGWADHVFKGQAPVHHQALFVSPALRRNVLAVTGACMAVARATFEQLGGFDEGFIVCGSDVELCLRAHRQGLLNVYVSESVMIHHESKTRDPRQIPETDFVMSAAAYAPYREEGDPFFNPNLDTMSPTPRFRVTGAAK